MTKYLLQIAGITSLVLILQVSGSAQKARKSTGRNDDSTADRLNGYDEIIIKRKGDKNAKVTIEIKDGEVLVDGKPVSEYNNDDLSVRKKKIRVMNGNNYSFSMPDEDQAFVMPPMPSMNEDDFRGNASGAPRSLFRNHNGQYSIDSDGWSGGSNRALLGVSSEKAADGEGAKIKQITKGSAAEKAGLRSGDIITKVNETTVNGPESLSEAIHKYKPEDKITVTLKREGKEQKMTATLGKMKSAQVYNFQYDMPDMNQFKFDNIAPDVNNFYFNAKPKLGIKAQDTEDGKGVKVLDIDDESAAEKAGIKEGDIITRFDGKEVNSAADLADGARAAKDKASVKVNLIREGKAQEIDIKTPRKLRTANL
jgi:serine protease Do